MRFDPSNQRGAEKRLARPKHEKIDRIIFEDADGRRHLDSAGRAVDVKRIRIGGDFRPIENESRPLDRSNSAEPDNVWNEPQGAQFLVRNDGASITSWFNLRIHPQQQIRSFETMEQIG
jgi:hypothetical protein